MGFLSRLAQLIKSNLNDLINKSEDPEKMLNQVIIDMNQQLVEAKKQVAIAIADEKRLHKQFGGEAKRVTGVGAQSHARGPLRATMSSRRRPSSARRNTTPSPRSIKSSGNARRRSRTSSKPL